MVTLDFPDEMLLVFASIGHFARERGWSPGQVEAAFNAGVAAAHNLGVFAHDDAQPDGRRVHFFATAGELTRVESGPGNGG